MKYPVISLLVPTALLGLATAFTGHDADAAIRLKTSAVVEGNTITLGDVIEGAGPKSSVAVAESPEPGQRMILRVARISALARKHGLDWPETAIRALPVSRASNIVPHNELVSKIKEALADTGVTGPITLNFSGRQQRLHVPRGSRATVAVDDIRFDRRSGRFNAIVHAPATSRTAMQIELKGIAHAVMDVPVLVNRVAIGDKISKHDIGWIKLRLDRTGRGIVTDAEDMIGMAPKRTVRANAPVRAADLRRPIMISKGGSVTLMVSVPGMTLVVLGRAMESGGHGDAIAVRNTQTGKIVQGVVVAPGQVRVRIAQNFPVALQGSSNRHAKIN